MNNKTLKNNHTFETQENQERQMGGDIPRTYPPSWHLPACTSFIARAKYIPKKTAQLTYKILQQHRYSFPFTNLHKLLETYWRISKIPYSTTPSAASMALRSTAQTRCHPWLSSLFGLATDGSCHTDLSTFVVRTQRIN